MIHFYYGYGKGKTTAAEGAALRCAGSGKKVLMFQFLKRNDSSERIIFEKFADVIRGRDNEKFVSQMTDAEKKESSLYYKEKLSEISGKANNYDMIILDEAGDAVEVGFLGEDDIISLAEKLNADTELIITGHKPLDEIIKAADYVTEMKKIKHPYDKDIKARKGIEF